MLGLIFRWICSVSWKNCWVIPTNDEKSGDSANQKNENPTETLLDKITTLLDSLSAYLKRMGIDTHGVVKSINENGFYEFYQTIEDYDKLEKAGKLDKCSKVLFGISCIIGASAGSLGGSLAFGKVANEACNYFFEDKLGW